VIHAEMIPLNINSLSYTTIKLKKRITFNVEKDIDRAKGHTATA